MIDLQRETVLTFTEVPSHPIVGRRRRGSRLNISTIWRWFAKGVRPKSGGPRIKLETVLKGPNCRVTSVEALQRFFERITKDRDGELASAPRTTKQRERQSRAAAARCERDGW
ncbi:MAG: DUF1580 domain-containing protein [Gemmataceae bacterium]